MKYLYHTAMGLLAAGMVSTTTAATDSLQNWPQWRGPLANGVAPNGDPPVEWSETKNVKWKFKIPGEGDSTPIIWGDRVFILSTVNTGRKLEGAALPAGAQPPMAQPAPAGEGPPRGGRAGGRGGPPPPSEIHRWVVHCVDRNTGKLLWEKTARSEVPHEGHHPNNTYASYSPVTDGERLYVSFGSWGVYCYDLDGNLKWDRDLGKMRTAVGFGEGSSPALDGDKLVINWDHEDDDFITALDTRTGKTVWKTDRDERTTWSTPLVIAAEKGKQVVVAASGKARSYDLATGKLIWECAGLGPNAIPSPVTANGLVYLMSGFQRFSLMAVRYDRTGDLSGTDAIAWSITKATPYIPSPLLYDDLLYFFSVNSSKLSCYEAKSGNALIDAQQLEGLREIYASPVGAAGRVYLVGRDGNALVLKKGAKVELLAANKLDDHFDASPAIVGKELFLRGQEYLYCIGQK